MFKYVTINYKSGNDDKIITRNVIVKSNKSSSENMI